MPTAFRDLLFGQPDPEDLNHGQSVIVTARWVLVASGLLLTVIAPASVDELRVRVVMILALAVVNFGLHAQLLRGRPAADWVAYAASAADIVVITALVVLQRGYASDLYIFYFPAVLALSVAFDRLMTVVYAGSTVFLYLLVGLATAVPDQIPYLLIRCLVLAGVAICGQVYWGVEARRRHEAAAARQSLFPAGAQPAEAEPVPAPAG